MDTRKMFTVLVHTTFRPPSWICGRKFGSSTKIT